MLAYDDAAAMRDPAVHLYPAFAAAGDEAIAHIARRYPSWRSIPAVVDGDTAFQTRLAAMGGGGQTRVDFKRVLARHVKARFPDLEPGFVSGDLYRYGKTVAPDLGLTVEWHHVSGQGIGKILKVQVGARYQDKVATVAWPLPWFWGEAEQASWTYKTAQDLQACLEAAADFLEVFLPPFAAALVAHMAGGVFPGAGAVSAREAFAIAQQTLASDGMALAGAELQPTARRWGAAAGPDGRTRVHGEWQFRFLRPEGGSVRVAVPHQGAPRCLRFASRLARDEPIAEPWLDSEQVVRALAEDPRCPPESILVGLTLGYQRPWMPAACWRLDLIRPGSLARTLAWSDASSGALVFHA